MLIEITRGKSESLEYITEMVEKQNLKHPVLWDLDCRNNGNYGVTFWPVSYLIDADGKVFWEGNFARVVNRKRDSAALRKLLEAKLAELPTSQQIKNSKDKQP